ncbi:MAG: putative transposase, partial [Bacteroidota bacterium]
VKWGVLYIDEHFLPYHGMRVITLGWFTVRDRVLKGSYDFLANDEGFNPLLFLIRPSSEDLLQKIPEIINKAKKLAQEAGIDPKDLTVIFDREGYCAELFLALSDKEVPSGEKGPNAVNFISWAKYTDSWANEIDESKFTGEMTIKYAVQKSEVIKYYDTTREMNKYGTIRAIVIQSGRKKRRSVIYTNDMESPAVRIIQLICNRWGQENLIKTLKLRHLIDYHPGYISEELEEQPMTDNPELSEIKKKKANLTGRLNKQELKLAKKILKEKNAQLKLEDIEKREIDLMAEIRGLESQITLLEQKEDGLPEEVLFEQAHGGIKLSELDYEKKRFLDCIKVFAYHMEKKMCEHLEKYYKVRNVEKEVWPALTMIVRRGAYLRLEQGKLMVTLKKIQNLAVNDAARALCEELNLMRPETLDKFHLPVHFGVQQG